MLSDVLAIVLRVISFGVGGWLIFSTIDQALRSFVLPRSDRSFLTTTTFQVVYSLYARRFNTNTRFAEKDRVLAMLSPVAMFLLPLVWITLITLGYAAIYWAINPQLGVFNAITLSGSSLLTLGFAFQDTPTMIVLGFTQAALGMMLIALLIGYLPTMYSAFSQRETMVTKLEALAGSPPNAIVMIARLDATKMLYNTEDMKNYWMDWQNWFVQIEENHTTLAPMNFFRSPKPTRHWLIAAGTVLDTAAIIASSVRLDRASYEALVLNNGFLAMRTIADYFDVEYDPDPKHDDPISIEYDEFIDALKELRGLGVPLYDDWDECWDHFSGWRVNYDNVLMGLARITLAPYAMWISDRAFTWHPDDIPPAREGIGIQRRPRKDSEAQSVSE